MAALAAHPLSLRGPGLRSGVFSWLRVSGLLSFVVHVDDYDVISLEVIEEAKPVNEDFAERGTGEFRKNPTRRWKIQETRQGTLGPLE